LRLPLLDAMSREFRTEITDEMIAQSGSDAGRILQRVLHFSRREISRLKFQGEILVNGSRVHVHACLKPGDVLIARFPQDQAASSPSVDGFRPEVLLDDPDFVIVNKPAGMPVHPGHGHLEDSLGTRLTSWYAASGEAMAIRAVGRLDLEVSGAMLYAKSQPSAARLSRERQDGRLRKTYLAVVCGRPAPEAGTIDLPVARIEGDRRRGTSPEGKRAVTFYRTLASWKTADGWRSLVRVRILTGRTHQIRLHFSLAGYPLLGDALYGSASAEIARPALHCAGIVLRTPFSDLPAAASAPLAADMLACIPDSAMADLADINEAS